MSLPQRFDLPPLARMETNWHPPWMIGRLAQHGPKHLDGGEPADDSHIIGAFGDAFWMVVADGVGQEQNSRHGARIACTTIDAFLGNALKLGVQPSRTLLTEAFFAAREAIVHHAASLPVTSFATTLCAVLIQGEDVYAASLGDSGIVSGTRKDNGANPPTISLSPFCSSPQPPAKANSNPTYSIVNPEWKHALATRESHSPHITMIIVATDGANRFFLKEKSFDEAEAFDPSWPSYLENRLEALGPLHFVNIFAHFAIEVLNPAEVRDDRTLLVAFRPPQHLQLPVPRP